MKKWSEDTRKERLQGLTWGTLRLRGEMESRFIKAIQATQWKLYLVIFFGMLTVGPKQLANDQLNRKCVGNKYNQSLSVAATKMHLLLWEVKSLALAVLLWNPSPLYISEHTRHSTVRSHPLSEWRRDIMVPELLSGLA